jgi:DnaJ-class molecular chaperone
LAKKYHPDGEESNEELFKHINGAWEIIGNPTMRKLYDEARNLNHPGSGGRSNGNDKTWTYTTDQNGKYQKSPTMYS